MVGTKCVHYVLAGGPANSGEGLVQAGCRLALVHCRLQVGQPLCALGDTHMLHCRDLRYGLGADRCEPSVCFTPLVSSSFHSHVEVARRVQMASVPLQN